MNWRKSSYSGNGGGECIEVGTWHKSSYSGNGGANCVEVGRDSGVLVRDTKNNGNGPILRFTPEAWQRFTDGVKRVLARRAD